MKQHGLTLVEMMIVVVILGILAAAASPLTTRWVDNAKLNEGAAALDEAIGRAKAAAMRNTARINSSDQAASRLCFSAEKIKLVVPANATDPLTCDLTPVWSVTLSDRVKIKVDDANWQCSCFNNRGLITNPKPAVCDTCSSSLMFTFTTGDHSEDRSFH
ncbi:MAG: hypothetical protein B0W54_00500 [Cellvibrio sp. 79]|nr:MAG: hypothetical protein B0W54_00500 [Cellvibrio sp. 79]